MKTPLEVMLELSILWAKARKAEQAAAEDRCIQFPKAKQ
jgi:hypothetical protein